MSLHKSFIIFFDAVIMALFLSSLAMADGTNKVAGATIKEMQLSAIGMCSSFINAVERCTLADDPGQHLRCPIEPSVKAAASNRPEKCEISKSNKDEVVAAIKGMGKIGKNLAARVSGSSLDRLVFKASIKNVSAIRNHVHSTTASKSESCNKRYIQRKDMLTTYGAIYNGSQVTLSVPISATSNSVGSFVSKIQASSVQGNASRLTNVRVCEYRVHKSPLTCEPPKKDEEPEKDR